MMATDAPIWFYNAAVTMIQSPLTALALILLTSGFAVQHSADSTARAAAGPMADAPTPAQERLGTVSFAVTCAAAQQAAFSRGVALLHDFWYDEARPQFERVAAADPSCAMAHWGIAMSVFHQIWDRPDEAAMALGWREITAAQAHPARSARERGYIAALEGFYRPDGRRGYPMRIRAYADAMAGLYRHHPQDIDAGAFYALSLLAAEAPDDTSLIPERTALSVLEPLFARHPDHPGVVHYIIHACDTPALAGQGLAAARLYGRIAPSGPHAVHMPGHIFARLGMWQEDIDSNLASVAASQQDERLHQPGVAHQMHADEFLIYAYLQTAQDDKAKSLTDSLRSIGAHVDSLPGPDDMKGRSARYVNELRSIYRLEMHDWPAIKALQPMMGGNGMDTWYVFWAQGIAAGYLHDAALSSAALARFDDVMAMVKSSGNAYMLNDMEIYRNEMLGWKAFIAGDNDAAVTAMRAAADQQDKLGQGEVDLPAREMLGDLLMQLHKPQDALAEYKVALTLSPNRLNGLLSAGEAAEAAGLPGEAKPFYTLAAASTHNGKDTTRSDVAHAVQVATATAQPKAAPPPAAAATAQSKPAAKSKPKVAPRVSAPTSQQ